MDSTSWGIQQGIPWAPKEQYYLSWTYPSWSVVNLESGQGSRVAVYAPIYWVHSFGDEFNVRSKNLGFYSKISLGLGIDIGTNYIPWLCCHHQLNGKDIIMKATAAIKYIEVPEVLSMMTHTDSLNISYY